MDVRSVLEDSVFGQRESLGDTEVCIAVLDGPVDLSHPCFAGADLTRIDTLVQSPAGPGPMSLHGTHVTSLLLGQQGSPVVGVAPRCRGLILPVFQDGDNRVSQLDLARAIERAVHEGAHVINISGGERVPDGKPDYILAHALQLCENSGVLVVAAVGNDGCDCLQVPAAVPSVLAAGAAGGDGEPLPINNWGAAYRENGVLAPGEDIEGAAPGGGRVAMTGSSFAAPLVSGVAALLVAAQLRQGRTADPLAVRRAILDTASTPPCSPSEAPECRRYLAGQLSAARAYEHLSRGNDTAVSDPREPLPAAPPPPRASVKLLSDTGVNAAGQPPLPGTAVGESNKEVSIMDTNHVHPGSPEYGARPEQPGPDPAHGSEAALGGPPPSGVQAAAGWPGAGSAPVLPTADCACGGGNPPVQAAYPQQSETPSQPTRPAPTTPVDPRPAVGTSPSGVEPATACACGGSGPPDHPAYTQLADVPQQPPQPPPPGGRLGGDREADGVRPSCGCAGRDGNGSAPLVYAIGKIGWDFQTEAVRDAFRQEMDAFETETRDGQIIVTPGNPYDPIQLRAYLSANPEVCSKLTWILLLDDNIPAYALKAETPVGMAWGGEIPTVEGKETAYADGEKLNNLLKALAYPPVSSVYRSFREAIVGQSLKEDQKDYVSRVSVAGALTGRTIQMFSGQKVQEVEVESRALYTWNENALVEAIINAVHGDTKTRGVSIDDHVLTTTVRSLLDSIYNKFRNLGQSSADRALNYVGTNAFQAGAEIAQGLLSAKHIPGPDDRLYALDTVTVQKSPYSRQDSDCQDVIVRFFDPEDERHATLSLQFTVDVSKNPPVTIGRTKKFLGAM
ncbi:cyanobactin maturation protease PatG family protein [Streptomyces flavalbus]|uniref:S8 family serine peptidase n=1 Tax=Streptomyces flavalbus TaxID=2665155 RepID=A0ABW2WIM6_9ACTN